MERYSAVQDGHSGGRHGRQYPAAAASCCCTGDGLFRAQGAQGIGEPGIGVTGQIDVGGSTLDKGTAGLLQAHDFSLGGQFSGHRRSPPVVA